MATLDTLRALAEDIGPRGSGTDEERKAAEYLAGRLEALGLSPETQRFRSALSAYHPCALAAGVTLLAVFLLWQPQPVGAVAAVVLSALALASLLLELAFRPNLLRWLLPIGDSQNIYARIAPSGEARQSLVVVAHYDTGRAPRMVRSAGGLRLFGLLVPLSVGSIAAVAALSLAGVFAPIGLRPGTGAGAFEGFSLALRYASLVPGVIALAILALMIQADRAPFAAGGVDNAAGAAVALSLAERLTTEPLTGTEVIVAFTGCAEVGAYGADALLATLTAERADRMLFVIDRIGGNGCDPTVIAGERALRVAPSDPALVAIATRTLAANPELGGRVRSLANARGELSLGVHRGLRSIALGAMTPAGRAPNLPQLGGTPAGVDPDALSRVEETAWRLLRAFDGVEAAAA